MKAQIDRLEYFVLIPNLLYAKAIGITAGVMARRVGADNWIAMLIGFMVGIVVILLTTYLGSRFPDKTMIQYAEELLGKWVGRGIGLLLILFFILAFGTSANTMILHLKEYFLPSTPFFLLCLLYTLLSVYGVMSGVEVIFRYAIIGFLMSMLINLSMLNGTYRDFDLTHILPLLSRGLLKDIAASYYIFGDIGMAILGVGMFYPMLNQKKKIYTITFWSMVLATGMVVIWPLFEMAVMSEGVARQYTVVCMEQIRCAQLGRYFPRYELIMVSFFTFGTIVQSVAMFYCAQYGIKQITGIKNDKWITVVLGIVLTGVTYQMAYDHNQFINFLAFPFSQIAAGLSIGLPLLLWLVALFRGKLKAPQRDGTQN